MNVQNANLRGGKLGGIEVEGPGGPEGIHGPGVGTAA